MHHDATYKTVHHEAQPNLEERRTEMIRQGPIGMLFNLPMNDFGAFVEMAILPISVIALVILTFVSAIIHRYEPFVRVTRKSYIIISIVLALFSFVMGLIEKQGIALSGLSGTVCLFLLAIAYLPVWWVSSVIGDFWDRTDPFATSKDYRYEKVRLGAGGGSLFGRRNKAAFDDAMSDLENERERTRKQREEFESARAAADRERVQYERARADAERAARDARSRQQSAGSQASGSTRRSPEDVMRENYRHCKNRMQLEATHKNLQKIFHPDNGGSHDEYLAVEKIYQEMLKKI